jgi:AcrR family transcriptional regulator
MRMIANDVGVQTAALYHHFQSKEALLYRIVRAAQQDLIREMQDAAAQAETPAECLRSVIRVVTRFHGIRREEASVVQSDVRALKPASLAVVSSLQRRVERIMRDALEDAVDPVRFTSQELDVTALAILATCSSVAVWYEPGHSFELDAVAEHYADLFVTSVVRR